MTPVPSACKAELRPPMWSTLFPRFNFLPVSPADGGGVLAVHEWIPGAGVGETVEDAYADWFTRDAVARP